MLMFLILTQMNLFLTWKFNDKTELMFGSPAQIYKLTKPNF